MFDMGQIFDGIGVMATAWDTYNKGEAMADKYSSDATVYHNNYALDMLGAKDARNRGVRNVEAIRRKGKLMGGKQMAAMGGRRRMVRK